MFTHATYNAIIVTIASARDADASAGSARSAGATAGTPGGVASKRVDLVAALLGEADVVEALEQAVVGVVVELERLVEVDRGHRDAPVDDVDDDLDRRVVLDRRA